MRWDCAEAALLTVAWASVETAGSEATGEMPPEATALIEVAEVDVTDITAGTDVTDVTVDTGVTTETGVTPKTFSEFRLDPSSPDSFKISEMMSAFMSDCGIWESDGKSTWIDLVNQSLNLRI